MRIRLLALITLLGSFAGAAQVKTSGIAYQVGFIGYPSDPNSAATVSASSSVWTVPFLVPAPCTLTGFRVDQGASNGNIDIGIADLSLNVLAHIGTTASAGTGLRTYSLSSNYSLAPGTYLIFVGANNTTVTFTRAGVDGIIGTYQCTTSFPVGTALLNCAPAANMFSVVGLCSGGLTQ